MTLELSQNFRPTYEEILKNNKKLLDDINTQKHISLSIKGNTFVTSINQTEVEMFFRKDLKKY